MRALQQATTTDHFHLCRRTRRPRLRSKSGSPWWQYHRLCLSGADDRSEVLTLITEIAPKVKHISYVFSPKAAPYAHFYYESAQAAGEKIGVQTDINPVNEPTDIEPILVHLGTDGGVIFNADAFMNNNLKLAIDLAARYRVPAIYGGGSGGAKAGGLISYNLDVPAQVRQIAPYFDRILRGEKPADLPVQQPTQFQYVINLKTAKALGLAVPLSMQMTADEVIE